jgi:hypothetical protein
VKVQYATQRKEWEDTCSNLAVPSDYGMIVLSGKLMCGIFGLDGQLPERKVKGEPVDISTIA